MPKGAPPQPYERNICRFAFLAPDIQAMILEGRQPPDLTLTRLISETIPVCWEAQRRQFAIPC